MDVPARQTYVMALVTDQPGSKRGGQPPLVAQRRHISVEDDWRHGLRHVLVPELLQAGQELVQLLVRLENIGSQLIHRGNRAHTLAPRRGSTTPTNSVQIDGI